MFTNNLFTKYSEFVPQQNVCLLFHNIRFTRVRFVNTYKYTPKYTYRYSKIERQELLWNQIKAAIRPDILLPWICPTFAGVKTRQGIYGEKIINDVIQLPMSRR